MDGKPTVPKLNLFSAPSSSRKMIPIHRNQNMNRTMFENMNKQGFDKIMQANRNQFQSVQRPNMPKVIQ